MRRLVCLGACVMVLSLAGCPGEKEKGEKSAREQVVDDVGGAPKRMVDETEARVNAAADKAADRLEAATADTEEEKDEGGW